MERSGLRVVQSSQFPLLHRREDLHDQLATARWMIRHPDKMNCYDGTNNGVLAGALEQTLDQLEEEIRTTLRGHPIRLGFDYLVMAEATDLCSG